MKVLGMDVYVCILYLWIILDFWCSDVYMLVGFGDLDGIFFSKWLNVSDFEEFY